MDEGDHESEDGITPVSDGCITPLSKPNDLRSIEPVISSRNIPTIPLTVAQAMKRAPRPPSPSAHATTQRAHRNKNVDVPITEWADSHMPAQLRVIDPFEQTFTRLALFHLAQSINGQPIH